MYDFHYDLLTKIYISYKENNYHFIENFVRNYNLSNVTGGIINLSFMSKDEMKDEYHINYLDESIINMFLISTCIARKYVPSYINLIYSIEGCDYLDKIEDLDILYSIGLRSIIPVWNEKNRFGSGNRSNSGLSSEGVKLIKKAIDLGIAIDLSHANLNTFNDIINIIRVESATKDIVFFASHSNCRKLCDRDRNITDEQLLKIKELNGYVGLFSNKNFVTLNKDKSKQELIFDYIEHIKHVYDLFGSVDNIVISTDDMNFCGEANECYRDLNIFSYQTIKEELENELLKYFSKEQTDKLLFKNGEKIFKKIKKIGHN